MLRAARPDDLPALLALEAQFPGDRLGPRPFRHHLANPRATLRVLLDGDGLAGYFLLLVRAGSRRARLYSIAVDRDRRGRGHGAALLRDAERCARRLGCDRLGLEVRTDNAAAIGLYEQSGYRAAGAIADYYEDGQDALRFEKVLARP